jgi:hypothetical protein
MFQFLRRMKNGLVMMGVSIKMMWQHKKFFMFSLLEIVGSAASFLPLLIFVILTRDLFFNASNYPSWMPAVLVVSLVAVTISCTILFQIVNMCVDSATIHAATMVFEGQAMSVSASFYHVKRVFKKIVIWGLIEAVIKLLLRVLGGDEKDSKNWLGMLISATIGIAWKSATFFVLPVLLYEQVTLVESVKKSVAIFKKNLAETIGLMASIATLSGLLFTVCAGVGIVGSYVWHSMYNGMPLSDMHPLRNMIAIGLFVPIAICLGPVLRIATQIFKTAAYRYAEQKNAGIFNKYFLNHKGIHD